MLNEKDKNIEDKKVEKKSLSKDQFKEKRLERIKDLAKAREEIKNTRAMLNDARKKEKLLRTKKNDAKYEEKFSSLSKEERAVKKAQEKEELTKVREDIENTKTLLASVWRKEKKERIKFYKEKIVFAFASLKEKIVKQKPIDSFDDESTISENLNRINEKINDINQIEKNIESNMINKVDDSDGVKSEEEIQEVIGEETNSSEIKEAEESNVDETNTGEEIKEADTDDEKSDKEKKKKKNKGKKQKDGNHEKLIVFVSNVNISKAHEDAFEKVINSSTEILNSKKVKPIEQEIIKKYNELVSKEEPINFINALKYVAYENNIPLPEENAKKIILEMYVALVRGMGVPVGNYFITKSKSKKYKMENIDGYKNIYTLIESREILKLTNEFLAKKLETGASVKLFNGIAVTDYGKTVLYGGNLFI